MLGGVAKRNGQMGKWFREGRDGIKRREIRIPMKDELVRYYKVVGQYTICGR